MKIIKEIPLELYIKKTREKSKYSVLIIHFNNKKLRNILCEEIEKLKEK